MSSNKQPGLPTEVSYNEAVEASKKYFDGDDLAATVWVSKYNWVRPSRAAPSSCSEPT